MKEVTEEIPVPSDGDYVWTAISYASVLPQSIPSYQAQQGAHTGVSFGEV